MARGGYRQGSGRSKSGYYKGIYCGSTYELCWVIHSIDHNIKFIRFPNILERDGLKYYPDFLLDDGKTIIETKGYEKSDSVDRKTKLAESFGYIVNVLRKNDLLYAFNYVTETYKTTEYHILYDGYKPKYDYVCSHCTAKFSRDKKLKTDVVFCSRQCAGKFRNSVNEFDKETANYKRKITKEQALEIFNRTDKSLQGLADEYSVNKNAIWFIKQKKTFKWIHQ
jgi:hypothetical protein